MKSITIDLTNQAVSFGDEPVNLIEYLDATLASLTAMIKPLQEGEGFNNRECYDLCNERMSKFFEVTFPDIEMHPEITQQLLQKETRYVERKARAIDKKARKAAKAAAKREIGPAELKACRKE